MKHASAALWAASVALLAATSSSPVAAQSSLISINLGGSSSQPAASVASSAAAAAATSATAAAAAASAASSSSINTIAVTTPTGSDAVAPTQATTSAIVSPAYAAGTVTYIPDPLPSSTSIIDVTSLPSTVPAIDAKPSSNFTLPSATATGTFLALPSLTSNPYQVVFADTSGLPHYDWNLALNSSSSESKTALCASQMRFCQTAGCDTSDAELTNFCETKYMGVGCYCNKGASRLEQYQWPVMLADCQGRFTSCKDACIKPNQGIADQNSCIQTCQDNYGSTCGKPGQYAANYAVRKSGQKPTYSIVQGGTAQNSALASRANAGQLALATLATSALVALVLVGGL
ncbi:hypothetical protein BCV70DRAFT_197311 [Testicularia cyperi]|uniref:Extracellular membrane protein CFEM domain-containing protein n=1 Tax=Testicularia cyperi TaxID=1882483 RepID=A0A317XXR6_9BASI|nr:hypothetical protein BCV70DRAFT_197311 [Testicularia cyperi]